MMFCKVNAPQRTVVGVRFAALLLEKSESVSCKNASLVAGFMPFGSATVFRFLGDGLRKREYCSHQNAAALREIDTHAIALLKLLRALKLSIY